MGKGRRAIEKRGKKQELRKAGRVTTRIQQRSRCTTFRWSEVEAAGGEREAAWPALGSKQVAGRSRDNLGGSSRTQVAGPGESASTQQFRGKGSNGRHLPSWFSFYPPFSPAYVTSLGA